MTLSTFQVLCIPTLALAYGLMFWKATDRIKLAGTVLMLALAGWVGEQTCIQWYRYYRYAPDWWGFVGHVPVLVPLIWPAVIVSAMQVVRALAPELGRNGYALAVGVAVVFDASLMEVVAVHAGFWAWAEGGHLFVPLIGMLGWGFFGSAVAWIREGWIHSNKRLGGALGLQLALTAAGSIAFTHLALNVSWWVLFRWTPTGEMGVAGFAFVAALSTMCTAFVWRARPKRMRSDTAIARILAATVFFALLIANSLDPSFPSGQWVHVILVAVPYLLATPYFGVSSCRTSPSS